MYCPLWHCLNDMSQSALMDLLPDNWQPPPDVFITAREFYSLTDDYEYIRLKPIHREMRRKPHYSQEWRK